MKRVLYGLAWVLVIAALLGLQPRRVRRVIPPDARFNGKVILTYDVDWVVPERVLVDEVEEAARNILLRRFPGRYSIKAIYPLADGDGALAGYAVEFEASERERRIYRNGLPPLRMIVFSARRFMPPVLWESYSVGMSHLLAPFRRAGLRVERIVLAAGPGFYLKAGGRYWTAGGRPVDESYVRDCDIKRTLQAFGFTLESYRRDRKVADEVVRDWEHIFLGYDPYKDKVAFTELEFFVPLYVQKHWGLEGIDITEDPVHIYDSPYGHWSFAVNAFHTTAALLQYSELVYRGRRYGMRKTEVMDLKKEYLKRGDNQRNVKDVTWYIDYWVEIGVFSDAMERRDRYSWESEVLWQWGEHNRRLWEGKRYGLEGEEVAGAFIRSMGYQIKTYYYPPWPWQTSMPPERLWKVWHDWHLSFLKKRIIGFDTYYPPGRFEGVKNSCEPWIVIGGWGKSSQLIGLYTGTADQMASSVYGTKTFLPWINFYHPMYSVGDWGYLMPPRQFTNIPPALGIPSRVIAYEGEEIEFEIGVWDAEGDKVEWILEEFPFKVKEKRADYLRFKIDKPAGAYYAWVRYSDGHNTVYHPIHFLIRPTLYLGGGQ